MSTHTFRASTTQAALDLVQQELGPEAIIVSVRQVPGGPPWQAWKKPEVEVLAIPGRTSSRRSKSVHPNARGPNLPHGPAPRSTNQSGLTSQGSMHDISQPDVQTLISQLTAQLVESRARKAPTVRKMERSNVPATGSSGQPESSYHSNLVQIEKIFVKQGLNKQLAAKLLQVCQEALNPNALDDPKMIHKTIAGQLEAYIRTPQKDNTIFPTSERVVCLIGPSGVGKTSTCAKLATVATKRLGKKVAWVCADTIRTGAIALAEAYTQLLNIPLHLAYTPEDLKQVIGEEDADVILVDTPSYNPHQKAEIVELGAYLSAIGERTTYLLATATSKEADLIDAFSAISPFRLQGLIMTKTDETHTYGGVFNLAWRSQLPIVFYTSGPHALGNLHAARPRNLTTLLLGPTLAS